MDALKQPIFYRHLNAAVFGLSLTLITCNAFAAQIIWNGPATAGTGNLWSGANWLPNAPATTDDVKFFDVGAISGISNINNTVDTTMTIGSLQYGNTNNNHTTLIANNVALNILGPGTTGLTASDLTQGSGNTEQVNATITGLNGTLNLTNNAAFLNVDQGMAANGNGSQRATLNLGGLGNFNASVSRIDVGSTGVGGGLPGTSQNQTGTLLLANTNNLNVLYSQSSYITASVAIEVGYNGNGNPGGEDFLYLGQSNVIFADSIGIGRSKTAALMAFNPVITNNNPVAYIRGTNGTSSRVGWWVAGDMGPAGSGSATALGTNDFSNGTVDLMVGTMVMGQDSFNANDGSSASDVGKFIFTAGNVDINNLVLGNQECTAVAVAGPNKTALVGYMVLNGPAAVLKVNTNLTLGFTTTNSTAAKGTYGQLNITNGTAYVNNILTTSNAVSPLNGISLTGATLILSNTLALNTGGIPLTNFYAANSVLGLTINSNASLKASVGTLTTAGTTNVILISPTQPIFYSTYPTQFALIKFASLNVNNFGLSNTPAWAPGATLVSNGVNKSLDLLLPADPRPVITSEPVSFSGNPGNTVSFSVTVSGSSVTPLGYQWYLGSTPLMDGSTGDGSTNAGSMTSMLTITNAQVADSGNYFVVVTNIYGSVTSAPAAVLTISSGGPPSITGPANQTATQGNNATFTATVSANPPATIYWQTFGTNIPGATTSTLVVNNVQYPVNNGQLFSIIASNSFLSVTNTANLTVIVAPAITNQPASLVVTNTQSASFTVLAGGVPNPTYQWYKNSLANPISSVLNPTAATATFTIASAASSDTASYFVIVQNAAGAVTSSNVALTVNSTMSATALTPANGATGICYDTPLYITFSQAPTLRNSGKISIYNTANPSTPVDTLDMSQNVIMGGNAINVQPRAITSDTFTNFPVIITGNTAAIYPHLDLLTSNQTYYVTIDDGVFADPSGAYFAGIAANAWQFTTKVGGPANPANLVVAPDYSGDFATVQGALDSLPASNPSPVYINVRNGVYTEIVEFKKSNVVLRGQSRSGTIIGYPNNSFVNGSTHNRMAMKVNASNVALDNLTVTNETPQDLTQAEALMIESGAAQNIVNNCNVDSYQDTILANISTSKAYFYNSLIQGDVDFIWGGGNLFFTNCEIRYLIRAANAAALGPNPSPNQLTDISSNGFAFDSCAFTTPPGANPNDTIGRTRSITNGNTALINCFISTNIGGWSSDAIPTNNFRNWYYNCTNDLGASVTLSNGIPLSGGDPEVTLASSSAVWLYGWVPALSPNITSQPVAQTVTAGQSASFTVSATGIPDPTYQWMLNGAPISGATATTYNITSAVRTNGGNYTVAVSNGSGSVTSLVAVLTYSNTAPVAANTSYTRNAAVNQLNINIPGLLTNNVTDVDGDTISLVSVGVSTNGVTPVISGNYVIYYNTNAVADQFTYTVTDGFGGTNTALITVNVSTQPLFGQGTPGISSSGGSIVLSLAGIPNYSYSVQRSTNVTFVPFDTVLTTNAPNTGVFQFIDSAPPQPTAYYRLLYNP